MAVKRVKPIWRPFAGLWYWGLKQMCRMLRLFLPDRPEGRPRFMRVFWVLFYLPLEDAP